MAKNPALANQKRKPRLLWANPFCLLDTSSGASITVRQMLHQLVAQGYEVQVLGATVFDNPKGMVHLKEQFLDIHAQLHQLVEAQDGLLNHQLLVTYSTSRNHLTAHESELWYSQYAHLLEHFKPDVVWFYGGLALEKLIPDEARSRGVPSAFYLANGNYKATRFCRDIDLILTDSQATADMYRKNIGFAAKPVGKFIDPAMFVAKHHERKRLLYVNPSWAKGASVVVQLALQLERERPDIEIEVVEARADWSTLLRETTQKLGQERESLSNVIVTPNTNDMRDPYSRARVLLAPSLWWESSGRVLAEAMLNGIPALITNRGGMPEMVDDAGIAFDFPESCYEEPYQHLLSDEELQPLLDSIIAFYDDEAFYQIYVERAERVGEQKHHIDKATQRLVNAFAPLVKQRAGNKNFTVNQRKRHRQNLASEAGKPEFKLDASYLRMVQGKRSNEKVTKQQLATSDFDWQFNSKVIVLDNRAKLIKTGTADELEKLGAFGIVAFDPASEVANPKQYEGSETIQVFQHALLGDGQPGTLYTCLAPKMSSTLAPLPAAQLPEHRRQDIKVLTKLPINTIALDSIEGLESLDWLILDELSDATAILENGKRALKETLLIQARIALQPTHEKQPSLAELQHWASRNGFRFYRFNDMKYHSLFDAEAGEPPYQATELESADAVFLPSEERLKSLSDESKIKLSFILDVVFKAKDASRLLLDKLENSEYRLRYLTKKKYRFPTSVDIKRVDDTQLYVRNIQKIIDKNNGARIVQVGANDGCINDPIYNVVMRNKDRTKILLIEPQSNIIQYLENNYSYHPHAYIANYAIGPDAELNLYRIKPSYYSLFTKRYLVDSPNYRVPSGFASFDKKHVIKHAKGNLPENTNIEDAIEKLEIPSRNLLEVLDSVSWEDKHIDVLQVDAEGMDDQVIYACDIEFTKPKLINFERSHLPEKEYKELCIYLSRLGYSIYHYSASDTLAKLRYRENERVEKPRNISIKEGTVLFLDNDKSGFYRRCPVKIKSNNKVVIMLSFGKRDWVDKTSRAANEYAKNIGADFFLIKESAAPTSKELFLPEFEDTYGRKYKNLYAYKLYFPWKYLTHYGYEKVLLIDDSAVVLPGSPDIFSEVPAGYSGYAWSQPDEALISLAGISGWIRKKSGSSGCVIDAAENFYRSMLFGCVDFNRVKNKTTFSIDKKLLELDLRSYANTAVMIFDKSCVDAICPEEISKGSDLLYSIQPNQTLWWYLLSKHKLPVHKIDSHWNWLLGWNLPTPERRRMSSVIDCEVSKKAYITHVTSAYNNRASLIDQLSDAALRCWEPQDR